MIKDLVPPNDPILLQIAETIPPQEISSSKTQKNIQKILKASLGRRQNRNKPLLVGLAAPQIGLSQRIIAVDIGADGKGGLSNLKIFVNPKITWSSKETAQWYEGCWSTDRVCGIVERPVSIKVTAYTEDGKQIEQKFSGYTARIFQHEIDHLNGKEFVTHITDDEKLHWVEESEFSQYRNNEGWRNWSKKCSREKWEQIKGITPPKEELYVLGIKALIRNEKGQVLVLKDVSDQVTYWDLPGGKVIEGSTIEQTLKRELQEELGIKKVTSMKFFAACTSPLLRKHFKTGLALFVYECTTPTNTFTLSSEHSTYQWMSPKKAAQVLKVKFSSEVTDKIKSL